MIVHSQFCIIFSRDSGTHADIDLVSQTLPSFPFVASSLSAHGKMIASNRRFVNPFINLDSFERMLFGVRVVSMMACIAFSVTLMAGPFSMPDTLYMSRLNTYSEEIVAGIFSVLSDAMESDASSNVNNGVGLTTSELYILTWYSARQVTNAPQYMTVSLYGTCATYYTTLNETDYFDYENYETNDIDMYVKHNSTVIRDCTMGGLGYVLDYRDVMSTVGLDIVLDYAYTNGDGLTHAVGRKYEDYIKWLEKNKQSFLILFFVVIFLELVSFPLMFWYYLIKGRYMNPIREKILLHTLSFLSFAILIMGWVSLLDLVWLNYSFQKKIRDELNTFGFEYKLGTSFFIILWILMFLLFVSCMAWSGMEWCVSGSTISEDVYLNETSADAVMINDNNARALLDDLSQSDLEEDRRDYSDEDDEFNDNETAEFMRSCNLKQAFQNSRHFGSRRSHAVGEFNDDDGEISDFDDFNRFNNGDLDEAYEMQSITLRSSTDSDALRRQTVVPSSSMMF